MRNEVALLLTLLACGGGEPARPSHDALGPTIPPTLAAPKPPTVAEAPAEPTLATWRETLTRVWKDKPTGVGIPVELPQVETPDAALQLKLGLALNSEVLVGQSFAQIEDDGWVDNITWAAPFRANGLVDLAVTISGSGAYPSVRTRHTVADLVNGVVVGPEVFVDPDGLVALIDRALQQRLKEHPRGGEVDKPALGRSALANFELRADGLVFFVDLGIPHAAQAGAPSGAVKLDWKQLEPHIREPLTRVAGARR